MPYVVACPDPACLYSGTGACPSHPGAWLVAWLDRAAAGQRRLDALSADVRRALQEHDAALYALERREMGADDEVLHNREGLTKAA